MTVIFVLRIVARSSRKIYKSKNQKGCPSGQPLRHSTSQYYQNDFFPSFSCAFCIGFIPEDCPRACCLCLNNVNLELVVILPQVLLLSSMSAISRIGSRRTEATSLS